MKKEGPKRVHYYNWEKETQEERKNRKKKKNKKTKIKK